MKRLLLLASLLSAVACTPAPEPLPSIVGSGRAFPTTGLQPPNLSFVIAGNDPVRVRALLDAGADPNERWGETGDYFALEEAIRRYWAPQPERDAIVSDLLAHGADPNARYCPPGSRGPTITFCANEHGWTPLMAAVTSNQITIARTLLQAGARAGDEGPGRQTALDLARSDTMFDLILTSAFPGADAERRAAHDVLHRLSAGAVDVIRDDTLARLDATGEVSYGRLRLLVAATEPTNGSPVEGRREWLTRHLIEWAASGRPSSFESTGRLLLEHGADADTRVCRPPAFPAISVFACEVEHGITPLMYAELDVSDLAASLLKAHGADPTLRDWAGRSSQDYRRLGTEWRAERRPRGIP